MSIENFGRYLEGTASRPTTESYLSVAKRYTQFCKERGIGYTQESVFLFMEQFGSEYAKTKALYLYAIKKYLTFIGLTDVSKSINVKTYPTKRRMCLTKDEVKEFFDNCLLPVNALAFRLMYNHGMRIGEVLSIRVDECDLNNKTFIIVPEKRRAPRKYTERFLPTEYKYVQRVIKRRVGGTPYLIECSSTTLRRNFNTIAKLCSFYDRFISSGERLTPHILKHSFITHLIDMGYTLEQISVTFLRDQTVMSLQKYIHSTGVDEDKGRPII